jgi:hypothetical protein
VAIHGVIIAALLAQAPGPSVAATIEQRAESLRYRFENPSSFDTAELVPHFFEQTYDTNNLWLGGRVRYRLGPLPAETSAAATPTVTRRADDLDTFFQPNGNVIVSGTVGNASLRAWTARQRVVIGNRAAMQYGVGYSYRRDSARFHEGTKILRTSVPAAESREIVTTREFVTSQIHEVQWFATWSPHGSFSVSLDAAPFSLGRLAVELPDKYPGRTLVFRSRAAILAAETRWRRAIGSMALELSLRGERSFSYSRTARVRLQGLTFAVRAGTR